MINSGLLRLTLLRPRVVAAEEAFLADPEYAEQIAADAVREGQDPRAGRPPKGRAVSAASFRSLPPHGSARVERFIGRYVRLPRGTRSVRAGTHMRVLPWHHEVLAGIYERNPRPRQALISIAKKNSKTTLAAALALYHLTADGEQGGEVLIGSSDTETAMICWRFANRMVELEPRLGSVIRPYRDRLVHVPSDSVLQCVSGDPDHAQGRGPSFAVIDEVYLTDPDLWDHLLLGMAARRQPVLLGISTMGPARTTRT